MAEVLTRSRRPGEAILTEAAGARSRDTLTIAESQDFPANTLLGVVSAGGVVTVTKTDVAGKGVLTLADPAYAAGVKAGDYQVVFIEPAADAGAFVVEDPDGVVVGHGNVGVAFDGVVKFTIADGAADFVAGDTALVSIAIADPSAVGQYKAWDPEATDGTEVAKAMSIYPVTTGAGETAQVAAITADAELMAPNIAWPAGADASDKLAAEASLREVGVKLR